MTGKKNCETLLLGKELTPESTKEKVKNTIKTLPGRTRTPRDTKTLVQALLEFVNLEVIGKIVLKSKNIYIYICNKKCK